MVGDKIGSVTTIYTSGKEDQEASKKNSPELLATEIWENSTVLYGLKNGSCQERNIIQEVILQRLLISLNIMSNSELQENIEEYIGYKEKTPDLQLSNFLVSTNKCSPKDMDCLISLHNLDGKSLIAGYEVERAIGEGGMAAVYLATKIDTGKNVAIKIFAPPVSDVSTEIVRFKQECALAMKLESPYIVRCYDSGDFQGLYYLVMEYLDGMTLADRIEQQGHFNEKEALSIFNNILEGMWEAWNRNIIHRDIKPGNVMIGDGYIKICDFGLAKALDHDEKITMTGAIMGTPQYMAPEQFSTSTVDYRADVYSLGVTFYTMLTGRLPFIGNSYLELSQAHIQDIPIHPNNINIKISKPLTAFIFKILSKKPEDRCKNPTELMSNLRRVQENKYPKGGVSYFRQKHKRRFVKTILILIIILSMSVAITWEFIRRKKQEEFRQKQNSIKRGELELEKQKEIERKKLAEQQRKIKEEQRIREKQILEQKIQAEKEMKRRKKQIEEQQKQERKKLLEEMLRETKSILPELNWQVTYRHIKNIEEKFGLPPKVKKLKQDTEKLYKAEQQFLKGDIVKVRSKLTDLKSTIGDKGIAIILQRWLQQGEHNEQLVLLWLEFDKNITQYLPDVIIGYKQIWLQNAFIKMTSKTARKFASVLVSGGKESQKMAHYLTSLRTSLFLFKNVRNAPEKTQQLSNLSPSIVDTGYNYLSLQEKNSIAKYFVHIITNNNAKVSLRIAKLILKEKREILRKNFTISLGKVRHEVSCKILEMILFEDSSIPLQIIAARALAHHNQYKSLYQVLEKSESLVKKASLEAILNKKNKATQALLIKALQNFDVEIRKMAAQSLVYFPNDTTITELGQALDDDNNDVRAFAAFSLSEINTPKALNLLIEAMKNSDSVISLKVFGKSIAKTQRQEALLVLVEMCTESRRLFKACEKPIVSFGNKAISPLIEVFQDADPRDVRLLADLFEQIGASAASDLSNLLTKTHEFFRQKVLIKTLGKIADPIAIPILTSMLSKSGLKTYARRALKQIYSELPENSAQRLEIKNALDNY